MKKVYIVFKEQNFENTTEVVIDKIFKARHYAEEYIASQIDRDPKMRGRYWFIGQKVEPDKFYVGRHHLEEKTDGSILE